MTNKWRRNPLVYIKSLEWLYAKIKMCMRRKEKSRIRVPIWFFFLSLLLWKWNWWVCLALTVLTFQKRKRQSYSGGSPPPIYHYQSSSFRCLLLSFYIRTLGLSFPIEFDEYFIFAQLSCSTPIHERKATPSAWARVKRPRRLGTHTHKQTRTSEKNRWRKDYV